MQKLILTHIWVYTWIIKMHFSILMYFHVLTLDYFIAAETVLLCTAAAAAAAAATATTTTTIIWLLSYRQSPYTDYCYTSFTRCRKKNSEVQIWHIRPQFRDYYFITKITLWTMCRIQLQNIPSQNMSLEYMWTIGKNSWSHQMIGLILVLGLLSA